MTQDNLINTLSYHPPSLRPPSDMYPSGLGRLIFTPRPLFSIQIQRAKIILIPQKGQRLSLIPQMSLLLTIKQIDKRTQILSKITTDKTSQLPAGYSQS